MLDVGARKIQTKSNPSNAGTEHPAAGALATSGDCRHFRVSAGKGLAHPIDPATGCPLDNGGTSVTVHAPFCWKADAWATALMVPGPHRGVAIAQARDLATLFLLHGPGGLRDVAAGDVDALTGRMSFGRYLR
jgi:thiamine biosynthesis lipoprotein ApbE